MKTISMRKKAVAAVVACIMAVGMLGMFGCSDSGSSSANSGGTPQLIKASDPIGTHHAVIQVKGYDPIQVELNGDKAPVSVQNFMDLANSGFYNGLTFHRIIDGFMMQGGDPAGNGTGGSDETIVGEFTSNGYDNDLKNVRGAIAMARSSDPNSASSQFFIVQEDSSWLDGDYAVFGTVTDGMDVVDTICKSAKPTDSNGTIKEAEQPIIESIIITD